MFIGGKVISISMYSCCHTFAGVLIILIAVSIYQNLLVVVCYVFSVHIDIWVAM